MAIRGKYRFFVCDTITERDSLGEQLKEPEGVQCYVKYPDYTDGSDGLIDSEHAHTFNGKLYLFVEGIWDLIKTEPGTPLPTPSGPNQYLSVNDDGELVWQEVIAESGGLTAIVLPVDVINNNEVANTMQDVTGLSFPVLAGKTYYFKFLIRYTAAEATTGSRWGVNCSAGTAAGLSLISEYTLTSTTSTRNAQVQEFDSPDESNATSVVAVNFATIEGLFTPTADGTFSARFASGVANSAITAKGGQSVCYYQQLN